MTEARTTEKTTIPVASLRAASVSRSAESFAGTFTLLNISRTVAVSVGAMSAPKMNAVLRGSPARVQSARPATTVEITTPSVASARAGLMTDLSSLDLMFIIASKRSGGRIRATK